MDAELLHLEHETLTVQDAARALGCHPNQIVKSVLFVVDEQPYLCIGYGTQPMSRRKLANRLGVGRKRIKLADAQAVLKHTGYAVGTVPALGHPTALTCFIDPGVLEQEIVYAGGGGTSTMLRIRSAALQDHIKADVLDLMLEP